MNLKMDELARLRAANPAPIEPDRSRSPVAAATLVRILEESGDARIPVNEHDRGRRYRRRILTRSSRRLIVVLAGALVAGGCAFAATDPLGWWSSNPTYARYGSNPAVHVRTPTAQTLVCARSSGALRCVAASWAPSSRLPLVAGRPTARQPYQFAFAIAPPVHGISRQRLLAYIARERAAGTMSAANAARFRADLAAVPNSFFAELELAGRYATFGGSGETRGGLTQVPPAGVPTAIVCEPAGSGVSCQNLNGDEHAPVGAGVYGAIPNRSWRYKRVPPENWQLPPGVSLTRADYRVLIDMARFATVSHTSGPRSRTAPPAPRVTSTPGS
jgi:hypothetical protein